MKLYIMRHGEVELNVKKLLNGRNDSELTKTGIIETELKRREVRKLDIDQIFCSSSVRNQHHHVSVATIHTTHALQHDIIGVHHRNIKTKELIHRIVGNGG